MTTRGGRSRGGSGGKKGLPVGPIVFGSVAFIAAVVGFVLFAGGDPPKKPKRSKPATAKPKKKKKRAPKDTASTPEEASGPAIDETVLRAEFAAQAEPLIAMATAVGACDWERRERAAAAIQAAPDGIEQAVAALLTRGTPAMRAAGAAAAMAVPHESLLTPLLKALQDAEEPVAREAADALAARPKQVRLSHLSKLLEHAQPHTRRYALALIAWHDLEAERDLARVCRTGTVRDRIHACYALGVTTPERAVEPLAELLRHEDAFLRSAAAWALIRAETTTATNALVDYLTSEEAEPEEARRLAPMILGMLGGQEAVAWLTASAGAKDAKTRAAVLEGLASAAPKESFAIFKRGLTDGDLEVQEAAVRGLGRNASPEAFDLLLPILKSKDPATAGMPWQSAWQFFVRFGAAEVPRLAELLDDPREEVRDNVITALSYIAVPECVPVFIAALRDGEEKFSLGNLKVTMGLKRIGEPAVLPLINALKGADEDLAMELAMVLTQITGSEQVDDTYEEWKAWYDDR